ncbi:MAG: tetratricopeptide repeat protein [Candidatus Contendobacter sp.]|nr:tetratricopeptide repeat protein [Candidatus Contendobacter sp.]MDG4557311.1 tetratricopeptide repeat protein [Candidatus Contendobacter sp.]
MEQYTDDERVEDLKKWWKENGASILIGVALCVIAIFGWRYWNSHRDAQAEAASLAYDAFVAAVEKPDADQARQRGQALATDFPQSPYAALAALRLAKLAVANGDAAAAGRQLEWVIGNARSDELRDIARLRLARVRLAAGQTTEAEKLLGGVATASLNAEREELKGDLYLAGNQPDQARTAYAAALAASGGNRLLQLKLDNLAVATPDTVVPAPPTPPPPESAKPEAALVAPAEAASTSPAPATRPAADSAPVAPVPTEPAPVSTEPASAPVAPVPTEPAPMAAPVPPASTSGQ